MLPFGRFPMACAIPMMSVFSALLLLLLLLLASSSSVDAMKIMDLSQPYEKANMTFADAADLNAIADDVFWYNGFIALECGQVVAERYDQVVADENTYLHMYSITKSWIGLIFGVMELEGLIRINETLVDIWPDPTIWDKVEDADARKQTTIEQILEVNGGYELPERAASDLATDLNPFGDSGHVAGGEDFQTSLTYHELNP
jgi:CubicO group peptidase (beta-lactamase class C family)